MLVKIATGTTQDEFPYNKLLEAHFAEAKISKIIFAFTPAIRLAV